MFLLRDLHTGPYFAALTVNLSQLKIVRVGFSAGRVAKRDPRWIRASWTSEASERMIIVRVPILTVKIGPYVFLSSSAYSKNCFPERANWNRLPTTGQPGGPGGRFNRFFVFEFHRASVKTKPEMIIASNVKPREKEKKDIIALLESLHAGVSERREGDDIYIETE